MLDYFVLTQIIIDDIYFPDGHNMPNQLGGGVYTAAGMRVWSQNIGICSGLGPDFQNNYDQWFLRNGIDVAAAPRQERCTRSKINYFEDGEREEIALPGYGSPQLMQPNFSEIPASYGSCQGMYLFKDCEVAFWEDAARYLKANPMVSVWEIFGGSATTENRDAVAGCLSIVDLFSLNLTEGRRLCQKQDALEILRELHNLHAKAVILRMGANGALVSDGKSICHVPAVQTDVVDVTGGGNASTGGFLAGWCQSGGDIGKAGICAAVSASFAINQYGVPPFFDDALAKKAALRANSLEPVFIARNAV